MIPLAPSEKEQGLTTLRKLPGLIPYLIHQLVSIGFPLFCLYANCSRYTKQSDISIELRLFLTVIILIGVFLGQTGRYKTKQEAFWLLSVTFGFMIVINYVNAVYRDSLQLKEGKLIPFLYDYTVRTFWIPSTLQAGYLLGIILRTIVSRLQRH